MSLFSNPIFWLMAWGLLLPFAIDFGWIPSRFVPYHWVFIHMVTCVFGLLVLIGFLA